MNSTRKSTECLTFILALCAVMNMNVLFFHYEYSPIGYNFYRFFLVFVLICAMCYEGLQLTNKTVDIFRLLAIIFGIFLFFWQSFDVGKYRFASIMNFAKYSLVIMLFLLSKAELLAVYKKYEKILAIILVPGIFIFVLHVIGIRLPYEFIRPSANREIYQYYYNYFGNLVMYEDMRKIRLCSIFNEPGVVGTSCGLLLSADGYNIKKKWENRVFFVAGLLSLSAAFYLITIIYFILYYLVINRDVHKAVLLMLITPTIGIINFVIAKLSDTYRVLIYEKIWRLLSTGESNRKSVRLENAVIHMFDSLRFLVGYGTGSHVDISRTSSILRVIYNNGLIGLGIFSLFLVFAYLSEARHGGKKCVAFFLVYIISLYQRPYMMELFAVLILIGGLASDSMSDYLNMGNEEMLGTSTGNLR